MALWIATGTRGIAPGDGIIAGDNDTGAIQVRAARAVVFLSAESDIDLVLDIQGVCIAFVVTFGISDAVTVVFTDGLPGFKSFGMAFFKAFIMTDFIVVVSTKIIAFVISFLKAALIAGLCSFYDVGLVCISADTAGQGKNKGKGEKDGKNTFHGKAPQKHQFKSV